MRLVLYNGPNTFGRIADVAALVLSIDIEDRLIDVYPTEVLATAVAFEFADFRYGESWRGSCPRLREWLHVVRERPSMTATRPRVQKY